MKDLIEQHLEAIESTRLIFKNKIGNIDIEEAAEKCAEISKNYGEIRYLEGMIEAFKTSDILKEHPFFISKIKKLEKDLENLKNPKNATPER